MRYYVIPLIMAALGIVAACTDELYEQESGCADGNSDEIKFAVVTTEMADQIVSLGQTRGMTDSARATLHRGDGFVAHPVEGGPEGLKVVRQVMPRLDLQPHAVHVAPAPDGDASTRAAVSDIIATSTSGDVFHDSLTIWGYTNTGNVLFRQILLKKVRNWRSNVVWPYTIGLTQPTQMTFYALAPSMETLDLTVADETANFTTQPTFTYTLPESATEMVDLLYGMSSPRNIYIQSGPTGITEGDPKGENIGLDNKQVTLQFQHILTGIRFSRGVLPENLSITKIELQGAYSRGTFDPATTDGATGTAGTWSAQGGTSSYTLCPNVASDNKNTFIDGDSLFFMIPQMVPTGAKLYVTLKETAGANINKVHRLSCSLAGDEWKKGYTVNYKITIGELESDYSITATNPAPLEHSNATQAGSFSVQSYHNYQDYSAIVTKDDAGVVSHHEAEWNIVGYSIDNEHFYPTKDDDHFSEQLKWLTDISAVKATSGNYIGGAVTVNYIVSKQAYTFSTTHSDVINANSDAQTLMESKDKTKPAFDLSWYSPNAEKYASQETANCYIVNRRGSYIFPYVYGNGKTTGVPFVDHLGAPITNSSIKEQIENKAHTIVNVDGTYRTETSYVFDMATPFTRCVVLWQDVSGLVTVSQVTGNFNFTVNAGIKPGNAVLAVQARKKKEYQKKVGDSEPYTWVVDTDKDDDGYTDGVFQYGAEEGWETLWSWHIWVTDEVYANDGKLGNDQGYVDQVYLNNTATKTTNSNHIVSLNNKAVDGIADSGSPNTNKILPVNLGWVPDENDFGRYDRRRVWVKLQQAVPETGDKKECVVLITQHARQDLITGTSTYYQWGRPTAFPGIYKMDDPPTKRSIFDGSGANITSQFQLATTMATTLAGTVGEAIAHPYRVQRMASNPDTWFDVENDTHQLWKTTYADKTVYDPCPPGFYMPSYEIFRVFDRDQNSQGFALDGEELNIFPDSLGTKSAESGKGGYFFVDYYDAKNFNRYNQTVYIPCTGEYHGNKPDYSDMSVNGDFFDNPYGIYWTGDAANTSGVVKAPALWIAPSWTHTGTNDTGGDEGKPAMKSKPINNFSSIRAVRPAAKLPVTTP